MNWMSQAGNRKGCMTSLAVVRKVNLSLVCGLDESLAGGLDESTS